MRMMLDAYFRQLGEREAEEAAAASGEVAALAVVAGHAAGKADGLSPPSSSQGVEAGAPTAPLPSPPADPVPPEPTPMPKPMPRPAEPKNGGEEKVEVKLSDGEAVVGEVSMPFAAKLVYKPGSLRLTAAVKLAGNKKVSPNTVLAVAKDGKMETAGAGSSAPKGAGSTAAASSLSWQFTKTKDVLVSAGGGPVKSLHDFIKETGATTVMKHKPWKGAVPTTLEFAGPDCRNFVPTAAAIVAIV